MMCHRLFSTSKIDELFVVAICYNSLPGASNPIDSNQALLALGTYGSFNASTTQGYTTVFDKSGGGQIQSTAGNLQAAVGTNVPVVSLDPPMAVNMNGIRLTADAIPVTMENVGYILDKVSSFFLVCDTTMCWGLQRKADIPCDLTSSLVTRQPMALLPSIPSTLASQTCYLQCTSQDPHFRSQTSWPPLASIVESLHTLPTAPWRLSTSLMSAGVLGPETV